MDLFETEDHEKSIEGIRDPSGKGVCDPPLAYRMSPRDFDEYAGGRGTSSGRAGS
jgi:hypothetical protein